VETKVEIRRCSKAKVEIGEIMRLWRTADFKFEVEGNFDETVSKISEGSFVQSTFRQVIKVSL